MKFGLYINNNIVFSSSYWDDCVAQGCKNIYKRYEHDTLSVTDYLRATEDWLADKSMLTINGNDGKRLRVKDELYEIKAVEEQKYKITYTTYFQDEPTCYTDCLKITKEYICYEDKVGNVFRELRKELQSNVEKEINKGADGETFDEMVGSYIDCWEDSDVLYDVFNKVNKKCHIIKVFRI